MSELPECLDFADAKAPYDITEQDIIIRPLQVFGICVFQVFGESPKGKVAVKFRKYPGFLLFSDPVNVTERNRSTSRNENGYNVIFM